MKKVTTLLLALITPFAAQASQDRFVLETDFKTPKELEVSGKKSFEEMLKEYRIPESEKAFLKSIKKGEIQLMNLTREEIIYLKSLPKEIRSQLFESTSIDPCST